jgi:hypothetical protein
MARAAGWVSRKGAGGLLQEGLVRVVRDPATAGGADKGV